MPEHINYSSSIDDTVSAMDETFSSDGEIINVPCLSIK